MKLWFSLTANFPSEGILGHPIEVGMYKYPPDAFFTNVAACTSCVGIVQPLMAITILSSIAVSLCLYPPPDWESMEFLEHTEHLPKNITVKSS